MDPDLPPRRIVAVAIRFEGVLYSMPRPRRHHHIIRFIHEKTGANSIRGEQGFLLEDGRFVDRYEAAGIALKNGQVTQLQAPPQLYSEDLW